jgi:predicted aspartyl protease
MNRIKSYLKNHQPYIRGEIENGKLALNKGINNILIDTGFDGGMRLPSCLLDKLEKNYISLIKIRLADGSLSETKLWQGEISIFNKLHMALFIEGEGEPLLGMELASLLFSKFMINFDANIADYFSIQKK